MTEKRWKITNHEMIDLETGQIFTSKDDAYLHILNVIYNEIIMLKGDVK